MPGIMLVSIFVMTPRETYPYSKLTLFLGHSIHQINMESVIKFFIKLQVDTLLSWKTLSKTQGEGIKRRRKIWMSHTSMRGDSPARPPVISA
jgi:hypothetical protein